MNRLIEKNINLKIFVIIMQIAFMTEISFADKGNQPVYQDPFDLAAGGASLTRASRDGRIFANPALLPYGGQFNHWLGTRFSLLVNQGGCELAVNPCPLGASADASEEEAGSEDEILQKVFKKPVRVGYSFSLSWITSLYGISSFSRTEIDINAKKIGASGTPEITAEVESYTGLQTAFALRSPVRWFSMGGALKAVSAFNPNLSVGLEVLDEEDTAGYFQEQLEKDAIPKLGYGVDIGTLFFFQGKWIDYLLALKVDDVGDTKLAETNLITLPSSGDEEGAETVEEEVTATDDLSSFKEVRSVGMGLTFHTGGDQIHLSLDYRDIENVYEEPMFKRVYAGVKMTVRSYIGLAVGLHHGYASYGAELDFIFLKLNVSSFGREMSKKPGLDPRRNYMFSISSGF